MTGPAAGLIESLGLEPHPEGGYYRQTYRAAGAVDAPGFAGPRRFSTAIYFLLPRGSRSALHRMRSDEVWHFHDGGPLEVLEIDEAGAPVSTLLGRDLAAGQVFQHVVPAGRWFGAAPAAGTEYSLVGCTVAPGFDYADWELARRGPLLERYPAARGLIERLTTP
ncbi:MAG TPA: cupin domain-containing protein [Elusimicrobiota bacterium]|nr:cupin domain-containing protein [Elusimicrobiota bacterium]